MNDGFFSGETLHSLEKMERAPEFFKSETWQENMKRELKELFPGGGFPRMEENITGEQGEGESDVSARETAEAEKDREGLTDEQKADIKKRTHWSDEVIDAISSVEEAEIYIKAGLVEREINGKKCLVRPDIDWDQKDGMGRTNQERAEQGLPPLDKDGNPVELHHIGQHADSPLAELTPEEHRGAGNDTVLHDKTKDSEIDRNAFAKQRGDHWRSRAAEQKSDAEETQR